MEVKASRSFWFGLAGILAYEGLSLLIGFRILPNKVWLFLWPMSTVLAVPLGFRIEYWLHLVRGSPTSTEKEELVVRRRSRIFGIMYYVPMFAAVLGLIISWMLAVSIAIFLGLMVRIAWLHAKRPTASSI
jgi:hypothetical protein